MLRACQCCKRPTAAGVSARGRELRRSVGLWAWEKGKVKRASGDVGEEGDRPIARGSSRR